MFTFARCASLLLLALLTGCTSCMTDADATAIRIDPTLHVAPAGERVFPGQSTGEYYSVMHGDRIIAFDHLRPRPGQTYPEQMFYLETNRDSALDRTVRREVILRAGFGTIYSEKQCMYGLPTPRGPSSVIVSLGSNEDPGTWPEEVRSNPPTLPEITSISVISVVRGGPQYLVAVANYDSNGRVGSVSVVGSKDGDRSVDGDEGVSGNFQLFPQQLGRLGRFGLPVQLDIERYLKTRRLPLQKSTLPAVAAFVVLHFGFDEWLRVDELKDGAAASSKLLRPYVTAEEKILNPICAAQLHTQQAHGQSTVFY